jgi:hypothetical protein
MKLFSDQRGVSHLLLVGAIVVLGVVGFAGYRVMNADNDKDSAAVPAKIESKKDVQQAQKSLDNDNLDSDLNPSQLDDDLNDLL